MIRNGKQIRQKGFTLVEMLAVILVMSIVLGATAWGVTGWIQHFTYIRNQETARYIYLGAQSGLSAYAGRGTLDEFFEAIENGNASDICKVDTFDVKRDYGLPTKHDNRDQDHVYAYLKCDKKTRVPGAPATGGIESNPLLYDLVRPYVSDVESLDGSIIVELDVTAKKVYSAFYSSWATGYEYGIAHAGSDDVGVRKKYAVYQEWASDTAETPDKDTRAENERMEHCVGYYDADQVNVYGLKLPNNLHVEEAMLYNEETLHLDFHSDSHNNENDTRYDIEFYEVAAGTYGDEPTGDPWFTVSFSPSAALNTPLSDGDVEPKQVMLDVTVSGNSTQTQLPFILSYRDTLSKEPENAGKKDIVLTLDTMMDSQMIASLSDQVDADGKTDKKGLSITRFLGDTPKLIQARVSVYASDLGAGNGANSKLSNVENDLYETERETEGVFGTEKPIKSDAYAIKNYRHLSNIRYGEARKTRNNLLDNTWVYTLTGNPDWRNTQMWYMGDDSYLRCALTGSGFPTIETLTKNSTLDGDGHGIFDLWLNNNSHVKYKHVNGEVVKNETLVNLAEQVGLFGENRGTIRRLFVNHAQMSLKTAQEAGGAAANKYGPLISDGIRAAGILCGREYGSMQEVYLDDECSIDATIFQQDTPVVSPGVGIGMLAGTLELGENSTSYLTATTIYGMKDRQLHDRLRIGGTLKGKISGASPVPDVVGSTEREEVFLRANAKNYAYGIGGVFGYVYGDYAQVALNKQSSVGLGQDEVKKNIETEKDGEKYYKKMMLLSRDTTKPEIIAETNDEAFCTNTYGNAYLQQSDLRSIVSYVDVNEEKKSSEEFVGGILGNIYVLTSDNDPSENTATDGIDPKIPSDILSPKIIGCENYGDIYGYDLVGGIVGVNGRNGYISECTDYGKVGAAEGMAAGIASENFGFIEECRVDRYIDDKGNEYIPSIIGNEHVAGGITCINHKSYVVKDSSCALLDKDVVSALTDDKLIKISGNNMDTFGYLVGMNYGVVDGSTAGNFLSYETKKDNIVIGGAVGINYPDGVVKNIESAMSLDTENAAIVGGVAGRNHGMIKDCRFSGVIDQSKNGRYTSSGLRIGGIAAVNEKETANQTGSPMIMDCYLVGGKIRAKGFASFTETENEAGKLRGSSMVGGICGCNNTGAKIRNSYLTAHYATDDDGNFVKNPDGSYKLQETSDKGRTIIDVANGMVGGIAAANLGEVLHCGYTDKAWLLRSDLQKGEHKRNAFAMFVTDPNAPEAGTEVQGKDMESFADVVLRYLEIATEGDGNRTGYLDSFDVQWAGKRDQQRSSLNPVVNSGMNADKELSATAAEKIRAIMLKGMTADPNNVISDLYTEKTAAQSIAKLSTDTEAKFNAMPKVATSEVGGYDLLDNTCLITQERGYGYVGGIAGYNGKDGVLQYCSTGKWVVEGYMPSEIFSVVGGIAGENAAEDAKFRYNLNLAYVRREKEYIEYKDKNKQDEHDAQLQAYIDHAFTYVGGVVGTQSNVTRDKWVVEGCANAGTVVNMYGNNIGGIIAKLRKNGGTVQYCYNYGTLMTGFSDNINRAYAGGPVLGGYQGTAGGIMSHMTELNTDQGINVISCQNHGVVNLPMRGITGRGKQTKGSGNWEKMIANDVGGLVGQLSSPLNDRYYTLNVIDCVNGWSAEVYTHSVVGGVLGRVGGLSSYQEDREVAETVNNVVLNLDSCRNYSDDLWYLNGSASVNAKVGGVFGKRMPYKSTVRAGYTSIQNSFSFRMNDFVSSSGTYAYTDNKGKMVCDETGEDTIDLSVNNFYVDNYSFQYLDPDQDGSRHGKAKTLFNPLTNQGDMTKVSSLVGKEPHNSIGYDKQNSVLNWNEQDVLNELGSDVVAKADAMYAAAGDVKISPKRFYAVSVGKDHGNGNNDDYEEEGNRALVLEDSMVAIGNANLKNSWIGEDQNGKEALLLGIKHNDHGNKTIHMAAIGPVITRFGEKGTGAGYSYSTNNTNHYYFGRQADGGVASFAGSSRLSIPDEYDFDAPALFTLDRDYIKFIGDIKEKQKPDEVYDVNVTKDDQSGRYKVTWKVKVPDAILAEDPGAKPTATKFDMQVDIYTLPAPTDNTSARPTVEQILAGTKVNLSGKDSLDQIVNAKTTTFTLPPDFVLDPSLNYYAVVRVRDYRYVERALGDTAGYSVIEDDDARKIHSYIKLAQKLPTPEFEIVAYQGRWMLHLLNPEDYVIYKDYDYYEDMKIGAYLTDEKGKRITATEIYLKGSDIEVPTLQSALLTNATRLQDRYYAIGKKNLNITFFAEADDCLAADTDLMMAYIPGNAKPEIQVDYLSETPIEQGTLQPDYEAVVKYVKLDSEEPDADAPPVSQIFRLELYGVKEDENTGDEYEVTLAFKDIPIAEGTQENIYIGYYDIPERLKPKAGEYVRFGTAFWYASSGQGRVNNYFETDERAVKKARNTGFITDLYTEYPDEPSKNVTYYFHTVRSFETTPEIEIVRLSRNGNWYAHLMNASSFDGLNAKINLNLKPDTGAEIRDGFDADHIADEALEFKGGELANMTGSAAGLISYWASAEGMFDSSEVIFGTGESNENTQLKKVLGTDTGVELVSLTNESIEMDENGKLNYKGTLSYKTHKTDPQFVAVELFAKDSKDQYDDKDKEKSLYLDLDVALENESGSTSVLTKEITIPIEPDAENGLDDLGRFYDFHLVVWYSAMNYRTNEKKLTQYYELKAKAVAEKNAYLRSNGILTYVDASWGGGSVSENTVYYFAAPLRDPDYKNDPAQLRLSEKTIARVKSAQLKDESSYELTWDVNSDISDENEYRIGVTYYKVDKGEDIQSAEDLTNAGDTVSGNSVSGNSVQKIARKKDTKTKDAYEITLPAAGDFEAGITDTSLDFENYDYYVVAEVSDADLPADDSGETTLPAFVKAYGATCFVKLPKQLPKPKFWIVADNDTWKLQLQNAEAFDEYRDASGFKLIAYADSKDHAVTFTASDLVETEDRPLYAKAMTELSAYIVNGQKDKAIHYCAVADGYFPSEVETDTVYVPSQTYPTGMRYSLTAKDGGDQLNAAAHTYEGTLTYTAFATSGTPAVAEQKFVAELYGIVKDGGTAADPDVCETLARQEISLAAGSSADVSLAVPAGIDPGRYESFGVETWYASPGQGKVYTYYRTSAAKATGKKRQTGYITDKSGDNTEYYYHKVKLAEPKIDVVSLRRSENMYARLLNPEDYEGIEEDVTVTVNVNGKIFSFKANEKNTTSPANVLPYGVMISGGVNGDKRVYAYAEAAGYDRSDNYDYKPANVLTIHIRHNLDGNQTYVAMTQLKNESLKLDGQGHLSYSAKLTSSSFVKSGGLQCFATELYAKEIATGRYVTLYLQLDRPLDLGNKWAMKDYDISFTVDDVDLSKYSDFGVTCWWSGYHYPEWTTPEKYIRNWFVIDQDMAASLNYSRSNGVLEFRGSSYQVGDQTVTLTDEDKPVYIYSAALADATYITDQKEGFTDTCTTNPLRINSSIARTNAVTAVANAENTITWTSQEGTQSSSYNLKATYYAVPKPDDPTDPATPPVVIGSVDDLKNLGVSAIVAEKEYKGITENPKKIPLPEGVTLDYDHNDYYAVVRVMSSSVRISDESALGAQNIISEFAGEGFVPLVPDLPKPIVTIDRLFKNTDYNTSFWRLHLHNPEDFMENGVLLDQNLKIYGTLYGVKLTIDMQNPQYVVLNAADSGRVLYISNESFSNPDTTGAASTLTVWAQGDNKEGAHYQYPVYLPNGTADTPPNAKISLSNDAAWTYDAATRTINVTGTMAYTGASKFTADIPQKFRIALIRTITPGPINYIYAHTDGGSDILVDVNGDPVSINSSIQVPDWFDDSDMTKYKMYVFYMSNDPSDIVTHQTPISLVTEDNLGKPAIFRDVFYKPELEKEWYVNWSLNTNIGSNVRKAEIRYQSSAP